MALVVQLCRARNLFHHLYQLTLCKYFTILTLINKLIQNCPMPCYQIIYHLKMMVTKYKMMPWLPRKNWDKISKVRRLINHNIIMEQAYLTNQVVQLIQLFPQFTDQPEYLSEIPLITTQTPTVRMCEAQSPSFMIMLKRSKGSNSWKRS